MSSVAPDTPSAGAVRPPFAVSLAAFTSSVDRFGISPLLLFIASDFDTSLSTVVAIASAYFLCYGLSQPLWGMLSDRLGRLAVMRIALLGGLLCGVGSALAQDLLLLAVTRALAGVFFGAIVPTSITYVGDTSEDRHRQSSLSDLMAAIAMGTALATAAAGVVGQATSWRIVFVLSAALSLASLLPLLRLAEPERDQPMSFAHSVRLIVREKWAMVVISIAFVEGALVLGLLVLLAPALEYRGVEPSLAGLSVAAYGVATMLSSRLVRPLTARLAPATVLGIGGLCLIAGFAVVAIHLSVVTVVLAALMLGSTWALMHSSMQAWATQVVPAARGMTVAFFAGALFAGSAAGSAIAGPVAEAGHWSGLFGVAAVLSVVLTAFAVVLRRRYQLR